MALTSKGFGDVSNWHSLSYHFPSAMSKMKKKKHKINNCILYYVSKLLDILEVDKRLCTCFMKLYVQLKKLWLVNFFLSKCLIGINLDWCKMGWVFASYGVSIFFLL